MRGFFKRNCLGLQQFLPLTQCSLIFAARSWGGLIFLALEPCTEAGTPCSWDIPLKFLSTTHVCSTSPSPICTPPAILDVCGFFNSVVVRLPFNSISDISEWWLFYILVVISMWLHEEVSHVCVHHHFDWKSSGVFEHYIAVLSLFSLDIFKLKE